MRRVLPLQSCDRPLPAWHSRQAEWEMPVNLEMSTKSRPNAAYQDIANASM